MSDNPIKVLLKSQCPHCKGEIYLEVESPTPTIKGVLRMVDITAAKDYVIGKVKEFYKSEEISKEDYDSAMDWLKSEETVFGPNDVESVINSIKN
jgi:hypothetical protein